MRRIRNNINVDEQEVGRWLISYADFITLLFAFFVVMYSISQVNASKYKELSQSLKGVFDTQYKSQQVIPIGEPSKSLHPVTGDDIEQPELDSESQENGQTDSENFATIEAFKDLERGLEASLGDLIDQDLAEINSDSNWINIVLKSALLFPSASDLLNPESKPLMDEVARHLNSNHQLILVHGHTDNLAINTEKFPSNWELSSARAVAVVRNLQKLNVQPNRLSIEGHGEYQPIADNKTVEGRRKNRRVIIAISRKKQVAQVIDELNDDKVEQKGSIKDTLLLEKPPALTQKEQEPEFEIIKLPGGGILIRGKDSPQNEEDKEADEQ